MEHGVEAWKYERISGFVQLWRVS